MSLISFIKDKFGWIVSTLLLNFFIVLLLWLFNSSKFLIIYIIFFVNVLFLINLFAEFFKKAKFYNELNEKTNNLDKKFLIQELINRPDFIEGQIVFDSIEQINKNMIENINSYKSNSEEYREYIELWVHEIKTPIASTKLIVENNKNLITKSIEEEIEKIDEYIEQVLFYSRSNNVEKDYFIKKTNINYVINEVVLKNKKSFINNKISLEKNDLNLDIYTDEKWLVFILNQIISNSIKYCINESPKITIVTMKEKDCVILEIKDNGIGIKQKDLGRVFEKGFTGKNGRKIKKSTGMGLYICKKLCDKLGYNISIKSVINKETIIRIKFPKNSMLDF